MKSQSLMSNSEDILKEGERIDDLQLNGLNIIQCENRFCFGIDAVLLSEFADVKKNENCLDIGTGTGIIPILLTAKTEGKHFTGLEIQKESADMANRSVIMNGLEERLNIICEDINNAKNLFEAQSFNVITSNPPYMIGSHGITNEDDEKAIARHEIKCTLDDIIREGARLLKVHGRFYMIHRPFRLVEIFNTFTKYGLEPKRMRLVHSFADKEPSMVLIEALKGGKSSLKIEKPLIIYKDVNVYSDEVMYIYSNKEK